MTAITGGITNKYVNQPTFNYAGGGGAFTGANAYGVAYTDIDIGDNYGGGGAGRSTCYTKNGTNGATVTYDLYGQFYSGGGGGGVYYGKTAATGGADGGGAGGSGDVGSDGTANLGGGGGGGGTKVTGVNVAYAGGYGGSGRVIIRYPDSFPAATVTGTPSIIVTGGFRYYFFNGSGTIKW
jgi:hypothetical protein